MRWKRGCIAILMMFHLTACGAIPYLPEQEQQQKKEAVEKSAEEQASIDTLYWMNGTYGLIIENNGLEMKYLGGIAPNDLLTKAMMKNALAESWDISSKTDADETLEWLINEGHNAYLLDDYETMGLSEYDRDGVKALSLGESATDNLCIYDAVGEYGENAIVAWDLARAIEVATWSYKAGYYTYDEAIEKSLEIAQKLQQTYGSWDEMMDSFMYGYQYWSGDDQEDTSSDTYKRRQIYETLKSETDSPYALDYKMVLDIEYALQNEVEVLR